MINLTPSFIEVILARDKIQRPVNTDSFDLSQLFGGWKSTQSELRKGSLNIKANNEQILAGSATARLTGIGIFFGKDTVTGLYEFRCGDPDNNYFHYDGTDLTIKGGTITSGSITIGTNAWHVDTSGNMWWGSAASYAAATIKISSAGSIDFTTGTFSGTLSAAAGTLGAITAGTFTGVSITATTIQNASSGARVVIGDSTNEIDIYASVSNEKSTIIGLTNELRLSMATNGGFVTLQANNDAGVLTEVLRADGDAGVTIGNDLSFTVENITINNTIAAKKGLYVYQNNAGGNSAIYVENDGTADTLYISQANASNSNKGINLTNAGSGTGLYVENTKTNASGTAVFGRTSGTGFAAYFDVVTNTSRQGATVGIDANTQYGAHLYLKPGASTPANPVTGDIYMDTDGVLYVYSLTGWAALNTAV